MHSKLVDILKLRKWGSPCLPNFNKLSPCWHRVRESHGMVSAEDMKGGLVLFVVLCGPGGVVLLSGDGDVVWFVNQYYIPVWGQKSRSSSQFDKFCKKVRKNQYGYQIPVRKPTVDLLTI